MDGALNRSLLPTLILSVALVTGCATAIRDSHVMSPASGRTAAAAKHATTDKSDKSDKSKEDADDEDDADDAPELADAKPVPGQKSEPLKAAVQAETAGRNPAFSRAPNKTAEADTSHASDSEMREVREMVKGISTRVDAIEGKLTTINDKLDSTRATIEALATTRSSAMLGGSQGHPSGARAASVTGNPVDLGGVPVPEEAAATDPEAGFTQDSAVGAFRKALIVFQSRNYADAVVAFTAFLEKHPDHPLAGSAQYYVGASYLKQKEYKLAAQEYQRVIGEYSQSPHVSDALRELADAEDQLQQGEDAARHRQLLSSLFAASPAASRIYARNEESPKRGSSASTSAVTGDGTATDAQPAADAGGRKSARQPSSVAPATGVVSAPANANPLTAAPPTAPAAPFPTAPAMSGAGSRPEIHPAMEGDAASASPKAAPLDPPPGMDPSDFSGGDDQ